MKKSETRVEQIYDVSTQELSNLVGKSIREACDLLEKYAIEIVTKIDIVNNRWILLNLLNVLYKDVFLLQTEDFEHVVESKPKKLDENLADRCYRCNNKLDNPANLKKIQENEKVKGHVLIVLFLLSIKEIGGMNPGLD